MWLLSDRCRENVISSIVYQFINPHKLVMFKQECLYGDRLKCLYILSACIWW